MQLYNSVVPLACIKVDLKLGYIHGVGRGGTLVSHDWLWEIESSHLWKSV